MNERSTTTKKIYVSKLKIWTKWSNFLRPILYDDDGDNDDPAMLL